MHCLFIQAGTAIINISSSSLQWDKAISNEGKHSAPAKAAPSRRLNTIFRRLGSAPLGSDSKVLRPMMIVCPVVKALKTFQIVGKPI